MNRIQSFFWYDLETFGLNPSYDRIAQFAGQRTDLDLNPIGDPVILYCRLSADYLPDPGACLVTGITPQTLKENHALPESEFIQKINELFSEKGTCVCGFNTLKFDDEFIRNALFRNFMDPYEREWKNDCSRWDILDLVRACHDFRPQGIVWPGANEKGNPVFKLTEMTAANHIEQIGAHDAMVDVNATIAVAKLIKQKQGRLFDYYLKLRSKVEVKNLLNLQQIPKPLLHTNAIFTNPKGCTSMIVPLSPRVNQDNSVYCFDLTKDPANLLAAGGDDVYKVPGLFRIAVNKVPFLAETSTLKLEDYFRLGIDYNLCMAHYETIVRNRNDLIIKLRENTDDNYEQSTDPDFSIYSGGFFTDYDKELFEVIRSTPAKQRLSLNLEFRDERCPEMLWRHVCRNYPEALTVEQLEKWKTFSASRLLSPPVDAINDIFFVDNKIKEKMSDPDISERDLNILKQLEDYSTRLKKYLNISK